MNVISLDRLAPVDPRKVWTTEAGDFTPWLAQEENLALVSDIIGLELELQATEHSVGSFRADVVCKDTATGNLVLIENQLERTDHNHLGQILTYAAGLNAVTVVWIARQFTDEHRAALNWLNDITPTSINFFGLEIELWRIGVSSIAPKFNVAIKPNDWLKAPVGELTETQVWQLEYWKTFVAYLSEHSKIVKPRKPSPLAYMDFAVGRSDFYLEVFVSIQKRQIGVSLVISGTQAKPYYHLLHQDKAAIEAETGASLTWYELSNKKSSYISFHMQDADPTDRSDWPRQHQRLLNALESFHQCFRPRIKMLDASTYEAQLLSDN